MTIPAIVGELVQNTLLVQVRGLSFRLPGKPVVVRDIADEKTVALAQFTVYSPVH